MHRNIGALSVVLIILFSTLTVFDSANPVKVTTAMEPQSVSGDDWPMLQYNPAHTSSPDNIAPITYDLLWRFDTMPSGGGNWIISSSPAIVGGVVYVGADDGCFYALNALTGICLWNQTLGRFTVSSPAVVGGVVYVSVWEGRDYALNATTGSVIWNISRSYGSSSPAVVNGLHYISSGGSSVIARNASTSVKVWETNINGGNEASPIVVDNVVYIADSGYVSALDALTGAIKWSKNLYISGTFNAPAVANGLVYVECGGSLVYALDADTGAQIWSFDTNANSGSTPTVAEGIVYVGSLNRGLFALNATSGAEIWNSPTNIWHSSFAVAGGVIYAGNDNGMYALNAYTGAQIWNYTPSNININSAPAIANGILYMKSGDNYLYAFGKASQSSISLFPKVNLAGSIVTVSGCGFAAHSIVTATFGGQPVTLSSSAVDSLGQFSGNFIISTTTPAGTYQITVTDNSGHTSSADFVVAAPATTSWPMFMHDNQHSGTTDNIAVVDNTLLWKFNVDKGEMANAVASSAAVVGGIVYIASQNGYLYALDAYTGTCFWRFNLDDSVLSSPVVANGVVYMGTMNGICAVDAYTGAQIWKTSKFTDAISTAAISKDTLYVGSFAENSLYAFRLSDGQQLWKYITGDYVNSSPVVDEDTVYVGSNDGYIYAINAATGTLRWQFNGGGTFPNSEMSPSPVVVNGVVYTACYDGNVYALDAASGSKIWNHSTAKLDSIFASPTYSNGMIFLPAGYGIYALSASNGEELWHFSNSAFPIQASLTTADGVIYVGGNDGTVHAFDAASGSELWQYSTGSIIVSATAISQGVLYVGTGSGSIYAIGSVQQIAPTPTPTLTPTVAPTYSNNNPTTNPTANTATSTVTPQQTPKPTPTASAAPSNTSTQQPTINTDQQPASSISTATLLIAGGVVGAVFVVGSVGLIHYNKRKLGVKEA